MKFKNKTSQPQQINLISGNAVNALPNEIVDVDISSIYLEERERITKFFSEVQGKKQEKKAKKMDEDFKIGGND